nr:hypothetical protein [Tanacetum cinerariifolium]
MTESPLVDSGFAVLVFSLGDDPIACLNKAMDFLTVVASSRVTVQQVQGRQGQSYSDTGYKSNATSYRRNNVSGQTRVVKCYNCQSERHMARQCTQPKRLSNVAWYKDKSMLAKAQEAGQVLNDEQLAFLVDPGVLYGQAVQTIIPNNAAFQIEDLDTYDSNCDDVSNAKVVLMANISNYGSDDLKAQIQDKVFVITSLKNDLRKIKGKEIVGIAEQKPSANTIVPGMFKLDLVPLATKLLRNKEAHIDYLKHTQEQAGILQGIIKQAKAKQPLDNALDFTCCPDCSLVFGLRMFKIHDREPLSAHKLYTPMVEKSKLDEDLQGKPVDATLYHGMIRFLMYLTSSRPDLIYAVCLCAWYQAKPTEKQLIMQVENGIMELYFVWTEYQLTDIFTKPLPREPFNFLIEKLGMRSMSLETLKRLAEEMDDDIYLLVYELDVTNLSIIMYSITAQQAKLDLELVPKQKRLEIRKCNRRLNPGKIKREPTFQVVLDALSLTSCYFAFLITADVLETVSWRNKIGMHTSRDDYLINTLRFVFAKEETQIYRPILPESLTSPEMKETQAYQTYLGFATGATAPKKARKFKKPASPKLTIVSVSTKAPTRKSKKLKTCQKKEKVDVTRGKGIKLLTQVDLTEDAQFKEVRKKTMRDFHKTYPSGLINDEDYNNNEQVSSNEDIDQEKDSDDDKTQSNNEHDSELEHETDKSESGLESDHDESKENEEDGGDEDETKITDKAEGDEDEEIDYTTSQLYDDVDIRLNEPDDTNEGFIQEEGTDAAMTYTKVPVTSSSHSSDLATKFLNFSDIPHSDVKIISLIVVHVQHEVPNFASVFQFNRVTPLEKEVAELKTNDPLKTQVTTLVDKHLDTRLGATIDEFMKFLSTSITARITKQIKDQLPQILLKEVSNFAPPVIQSMVTKSLEQAILDKESSQPQYLYEAATMLTDFELKKILINKRDKSESYLAAPEHKECYKGLKNSYDLDKTIFSTYGKVYSLKRSRKDKDEDPSAGSDRGLKKRKTSKDA